MKKQIHILNGDALNERFPVSIPGEKIIMRECLIEGNIDGEDLPTFYKNRAEFILNNYNDPDYYTKVVPEFVKMQNVPENYEINLWFEDDLFCQINMWFVINLLKDKSSEFNIFLIRPAVHNQYGFGGLTEKELITIFEKKVLLKKFKLLQNLWHIYQINDMGKLLEIADELRINYPFIFVAVQAHLERLTENNSLGRPLESLKSIMKELDTDHFGTIFKTFCERESIYGYSDLQVKRMLEKLQYE